MFNSDSLKETIITIDGPAGAGKSTVAKLVSEKLGFRYLDTGATYRAVTLYIVDNNVNIKNADEILKALQDVNISFTDDKKVMLNKKDVTSDIRSKRVVENVSAVSALKIVREKMVDLQRSIARNGKYVVDGRDTGSVVFKNALYKFYLDASVDERVSRRFLEESKKEGNTFTPESLKVSIIARDEYDKARKESPLVVPIDASVIDTTGMTIEDVVQKITDVVLDK